MVSHKLLLNVKYLLISRLPGPHLHSTNRGVRHANRTRRAGETPSRMPALHSHTWPPVAGKCPAPKLRGSCMRALPADPEWNPGPCSSTAGSENPDPLLQRASSPEAQRPRSTLISALLIPQPTPQAPVLLICSSS